MEQILQTLKQCLSNKRLGCMEALQSISMFAKAVGSEIDPFITENLQLLFDTGLSIVLTKCLSDLVIYIPSHLPIIQERLLDLLSIVLSGKPYYHSGTPASFRKKKVNAQVLFLPFLFPLFPPSILFTQTHGSIASRQQEKRARLTDSRNI